MGKHTTLNEARRYAKYLLHQATGGAMGTKPGEEDSGSSEDMTFAEKRGLLDSLIKISIIEEKFHSPEDGEESFAAIIQEVNNGNQKTKRGRNTGATEDITTGENPFTATN